MDRDPTQPDSYFVLAGAHGLPGGYCLHHVDRFNPWHRLYLKLFEDQLRSVPGCENVTLPYWDISTPMPALLAEAPFASYELPKPPVPAFPHQYFPYTTKRNTPEVFAQLLARYQVLEDIQASLTQAKWGKYNDRGYQLYSIQAHDGGHGSIGPTMADQNVASYDPVFWFFHCNIDRLWLTWQRNAHAETLADFRNTLTDGTAWLSPPGNALPPYSTTADQTIAFGITYDQLAGPPPGVSDEVPAMENAVGSIDAARAFSIKRTRPLSVRVKGIDRLNIPGSFAVNLLADGELVASRFFFQPKTPRDCETCKTLALVNLDFRLDAEQVFDRKLSVEIEVPGQEEIGAEFPLSQAGNPTVNARLLLEDE